VTGPCFDQNGPVPGRFNHADDDHRDAAREADRSMRATRRSWAQRSSPYAELHGLGSTIVNRSHMIALLFIV